MRHLYAGWETQARSCVALLRMQAAETPEDPRLVELVGELSVKDPDFRAWWAARHVDSKHFGTKTLRHPKAGDITLDWDTFGCAADPDRHLIIWTAEPDTQSHQALRFLASWTAEPPAAGRRHNHMTFDELPTTREIELTTTGRISGHSSSRPV